MPCHSSVRIVPRACHRTFTNNFFAKLSFITEGQQKDKSRASKTQLLVAGQLFAQLRDEGENRCCACDRLAVICKRSIRYDGLYKGHRSRNRILSAFSCDLGSSQVRRCGSLFSTRFMGHRYCYLLQPGLVSTNAVSDSFIWPSYIAISVGLAILLRKTRTLLSFRWAFVAFGLFIVACGFTHFFEVLTIWVPFYWLSTSVKMLTAAASVVTAIAFAPLVPRAAEAIRLFHEAHEKSEQQRVETLSKLLDTEERMKLAVQSSGLGTWELNASTNELHWDHRCRVVFGVSDHQELRYDDFISRVHPQDRANVEALFGGALPRQS